MKIIGIILVKNEDINIERVIKNIINFCDEIIILDNCSTDETWQKIIRISSQYKNVFSKQIADSLTSHSYIEKYAGTDTWIFGVDGDEIYDPGGLNIFKEKILRGEYNKWWSIRGNCLHVEEMDVEKKTATGYEAPPARSITKIFNFSLLSSWHETKSERLHGDGAKFNNLFNSEYKYLDLYKQYKWEESFFRCLHTCFLPRSSQGDIRARFNPTETSKIGFGVINFFRNLRKGIFSFESSYKIAKYKVGVKKTIDISSFFRDSI
jgi:glycosyltransferase involved in cell wall biosynthesis